MDCQRCGRCCSEAFYRQVRPEDVKDWKARGHVDLVQIYQEELSRRDHVNPDLAALGAALHSCRFLRPDGPDRFYCEIYDHRPTTCREFLVGRSRLCPAYEGKKKNRLKKGDPPKNF